LCDCEHKLAPKERVEQKTWLFNTELEQWSNKKPNVYIRLVFY
jgi:hypothetical protein